ncbi:MAG: outer membrane protein transport protein [Gammaproteobacteria bacterium]|nr:outer membrane protein transport protein [Gammaproteobacteria bacterium]
MKRFLGSTIVLLLGAGLVPLAHGTNGYSPTGFGTANKGMAGAGVALPQDSLAAATNPAGMALVGHRLDVGAAVFNPNRGFTANADGGPPFPSIPPGEFDSDRDIFLVPHFGWNRSLGTDAAIGISVGGNGGMNTDFDTAVWQNFSPPTAPDMFQASEPTGVDLAQLFIGFTYARQVSPNMAFGIMPIVAVQRFEAEGLEPFRAFSTSPNHVTNNGHDYSWGYGVRVGWLGRASERLTLGASYQSKLYMERFDDYRGLFAEDGDFDIPSTFTLGLSYAATPHVALVADWQRIHYSDVAALGNSNDLPPQPGILGSDGGLGFGWDDIDIIKLGIQWDRDEAWTFRAGLSHADQLFDKSETLFNILAPATIRTHASLGFTWRPDPGHAISLAYTRAFEEKISGSNPNFVGTQTGFVEMDQHELEVSWGIRFN